MNFQIGTDKEDVAHIFERLEESSGLPYYGGTHVITISQNDYVYSEGFWFNKDLIFKSKSSEATPGALDLLGGRRKLLVSLPPTIYHFVGETIPYILASLDQLHGDVDLVIDVSGVGDTMALPSRDMFHFFFKTLRDKGIAHKVVNFLDFKEVYIDDFFMARPDSLPLENFKNLARYFSSYVKESDYPPTKKVFLSRKKSVNIKPIPSYVDPLTGETKVSDLERIDDEAGLEAVFSSMGFEIVYPEDFSSFQDQINLFNSASHLASLTSAGLVNAVFMQRGTTLIEISTPVIGTPIVGGVKGLQNREFHNYYKNIAATMELLYVALPNPYCKLDEVKDFLSISSDFERMFGSDG